MFNEHTRTQKEAVLSCAAQREAPINPTQKNILENEKRQKRVATAPSLAIRPYYGLRIVENRILEI